MSEIIKEIDAEISNILSELRNKYGINANYYLAYVKNSNYIALYSKELNAIIFNLDVLVRFWKTNKQLTKKVLKPIIYHEYYHFLRGNGYTVIANKVLKVVYPSMFMSFSRFKILPFRFWEEINANKFMKKSGMSSKEVNKTLKELELEYLKL